MDYLRELFKADLSYANERIKAILNDETGAFFIKANGYDIEQTKAFCHD